MTHWYPATDMPFLPHFSEKSPPRCIKFRACSKRCNFSRAEIALKLQVVYTKIALKIATKIASKTASVNGPLLFSTHFCHLFAVSSYKNATVYLPIRWQYLLCRSPDNHNTPRSFYLLSKLPSFFVSFGRDQKTLICAIKSLEYDNFNL